MATFHFRTPDPKKKFNTLNTPRSGKKLQAHQFVPKVAVRMESCGPVSGLSIHHITFFSFNARLNLCSLCNSKQNAFDMNNTLICKKSAVVLIKFSIIF